LRLDLAQGAAQRRAIGGISRQHLIGERKAVGGHDQGDHHLDAVAALVATVAVAPLVIVILGRRRLKISTRQVVQQDFEIGAEQILPAFAQMIEQRRLVLQQLVETTVE
jgi:hypothetical protein